MAAALLGVASDGGRAIGRLDRTTRQQPPAIAGDRPALLP